MNINAQRIRLITIPLTCLVWMVFVILSHGAWLRWDHNDEPEKVIGYRVWVGTNSRNYVFIKDVGNINGWLIPRLSIPVGKTNYFAVTAYNSVGESELSAEVFTNWVVIALPPITNVTLRVPSGKFYVERGDTTAAWASASTVTGPTNMAFPITGVMGFYRYKPYFLSFANPKGAASKLMAAKKPVFKKKPAKTVEPQPARIIGPINLIPP